MHDTSLTPNPLREGITAQRTPEPCVLVIFGATGDLTHRKLVPALCNLAHEGQLPAQFAIVGFARRPKTNEEFRAELLQGVQQFSRFSPINPAVWETFAQGIFYHQGEFGDAGGYARLNELLQKLDRERGTAGNRIFYLATAPTDFATTIQRPGRQETGRIVVEKPFGRSLETARELNASLASVFDEPQVYRIDHYLG